MIFDILVREWIGQRCLFKKSKNKEGAEIETLLVNTEVIICASNDEDEYLLKIGKKMKLVTSRELSSPVAFRELIRPYSYLGAALELEYLLIYWRTIGIKHKLVNLSNYQGRYVDEFADFWVLNNGIQFALKSNLPDELKGTNSNLPFLPFPKSNSKIIDFVVGDKWYFINNTTTQEDMSLMVNSATPEAENLSDEDLLKGWGKLYNNVPLLYIILGWFIGCMYMKEVMECRGSKKFPLFALSGLTQSGKTSLISSLMRFWGVNARPSDYTQISPFAELKQLNSAHYFPLWRDEFRNFGHAFNKETILRSLYDRSSIPKGTASQDLLYYNTTGTLLLSGEGIVIDPAVRRRFIYFDLQDRFKLKDKDWAEAERWVVDFAPALFYRVLAAGFDKKAFKNIMANQMVYRGVNDIVEEKVCIASLGAVFGVPFAEAILEMIRKFWESERAGDEFIDDAKLNLVENLFEFLDSLFVNTGMYTPKEMMGVSYYPPVLNYFAYTQQGKFYIKLTHLVSYAFSRGFDKITTLDPRAVIAAIKGILKTKERKARIGGVMSRVVEVDKTNVQQNSILLVILDNIVAISEKVRKGGRSFKDDMDEDLVSYNDTNLEYMRKLREEGQPKLIQ